MAPGVYRSAGTEMTFRTSGVVLRDHPGSRSPRGRRFDEWVAMTTGRTRPTASGLEMITLGAIRSAGLPEPERQFGLVLGTGEPIHIDIAGRQCAWASSQDTRGGMADRRLSADYARDRACGELGWHIVRFDEPMSEDPNAAGLQIKRIYDARRATTAS